MYSYTHTPHIIFHLKITNYIQLYIYHQSQTCITQYTQTYIYISISPLYIYTHHTIYTHISHHITIYIIYTYYILYAYSHPFYMLCMSRSDRYISSPRPCHIAIMHICSCDVSPAFMTRIMIYPIHIYIWIYIYISHHIYINIYHITIHHTLYITHHSILYIRVYVMLANTSHIVHVIVVCLYVVCMWYYIICLLLYITVYAFFIGPSPIQWHDCIHVCCWAWMSHFFGSHHAPAWWEPSAQT